MKIKLLYMVNNFYIMSKKIVKIVTPMKKKLYCMNARHVQWNS
jgi:hypothetical protein